MRIAVNQDDIDQGVSCSRFRCPVARALKRRLPGREIRVLNTFVLINGYRHNLPAPAFEWIGRFDDGEHVTPIEFEIPDEGV